MKESVAIAKEADAKKEFLPTNNSIHHVRNEPGRQLGSLRGVIGNIRRNGGTPSVDSIATELSGMHTAERVPVLLALQRTHGNQYVQRVVAGIQAKLAVGQTGDIYEQKANRVADAVMRMTEPQVQRQTEEKEKKEEEILQTKPIAEQITPLVQRQVEEEEKEMEILQAKEIHDKTSEVTPTLASRIQSLKGGGQPLPESARDFFEPRFGQNFSSVRIHSNWEAAEMARAMNAKAFTVGRDLLFGAGQYSPDTSSGIRLLAHELTHVVQQEHAHSSASRTRVYCDISGTNPCQQPPSHINTMDDYIALVERTENEYSGTSTINMITRIRRTKYSGFPWSSFVAAPSSLGPLTASGSLTNDDIQAFACDIMVSMPGGGSTDPSHVIVGLDVHRYPSGSVLAPQGINAEAATTWAGDVGSAYSEYIAQNNPTSEASSDLRTRINYWNEFSPYHDLMADIDGLAMSARHPTQWNFDINQPLSVNLRNFFRPTAGQGRHRRFTLFADIAGIQWTGRGSGLAITTSSQTNVIERQIDLFAQGNLPTLAQIMLHSGGGDVIGNLLYWRKYNQRVRNRSWFIDRFMDFVQGGLQRENP